MSTRERRVTLALKWHHLDNLDVEQVRDRFEEEGIGSYAKSTIRDYLNEEPKEAVIEQIEAEHANVRLQIAEREERMYKRARESEAKATDDEPIRRTVPKTDTVPADRESPMSWPAWELVEHGDPERPEWAEERDIVIRFDGEKRTQVRPGERYPIQAIDGSPTYTTEMVGLERDVDDLKQQAMARQEQSQHLQAKGDVLGVYSTDVNLNVDGEMETTLSLDETAAAAIREADLKEDTDE